MASKLDQGIEPPQATSSETDERDPPEPTTLATSTVSWNSGSPIKMDHTRSAQPARMARQFWLTRSRT
jgi:hypothetical protein